MKAVRIHQYGSPDVLQYEQAAVPDIKENQILVKVEGTSVNHLEVLIASGKKKDQMPVDFPWIPGFDGAGIVDRVGSHVHGVELGDEIYFKSTGSSYAEYIVLDKEMFTKKPVNLSMIEAASVPHVGLTAWQALFTHGELEAGQAVLIHGGAGAVGAFAVQFAKYIGGIVYATASGKDIPFVESLGADIIIDYKTTDFTTIAKEMDLVLDLVGGDTQMKSYSIIKPGGRLVTTTGLVTEEEAKSSEVKAIAMVVEPNKEDQEAITKAIEAGKIKPDVAITYPLEEVEKAWQTYQHKTPDAEKFTHGKVVLEI